MMENVLAVCFLVVLEGLLSFDNALALAAMVHHLPLTQRKKALTYGMVGAFLFRFLALSVVTWLMQATWVKLVGGSYLLWLMASHFLKGDSGNGARVKTLSFWPTVIIVEFTDIIFSADSILAAVAVSSKFWIVVCGGVLGIIAMRFVAGVFISLIERFPNLIASAYGLVGLVGAKLLVEATQVYTGLHVLDFEASSRLEFWVLWGLMLMILCAGFYRRDVHYGILVYEKRD